MTDIMKVTHEVIKAADDMPQCITHQETGND